MEYPVITLSRYRINTHPTIFFDGVCNLCNGFVQFIIRHDRKGLFKFASLQGEAGQQLLSQLNNPKSKETILLTLEGKIYYRSSAALEILKRLDGPVKLLYGAIIVPRFMRDGLYNMVARNRFKWFGRREECMIPAEGIKNRFVD